jgi:hypothetical protein
MTKKNFLPKELLLDSQEDFQDTPLTDKELKAEKARTNAMRHAAYLGGFTQFEIYETLLYLKEDSKRLDKMSMQFLKAVGIENIRRIHQQFMRDKR